MAAIFGLGNTELLIILGLVLILFGPKRLPQLGKSLGKTMRAVREGVDGKGGADDEEEDAEEIEAPKPKKPEAKAAEPAPAMNDNEKLEQG